jgi:hypothetical protein
MALPSGASMPQPRRDSLGESTKVLFRAEAFNVTNHVNFITPIDDINSPVFGQLVEAQSPRILQFALKLQR